MARQPAVQLPFHRSDASRKGRRLYRKQVLPAGTVEHPKHGPLEFTQDIIRELVRTFDGGAMTQVPFVLAAEGNLHTDDPERFRGQVKGLEAKDDGLYALVETSERGAQLLEENPKLPVSARIQRPLAGKFAGRPVLGHVLGTMDEVAKGMAPWELIEASGEVELVDLSDGAFTFAATVPDEKTDTPEFTKEDVEFLRELKGRMDRAQADKDGKDEPRRTETDTATEDEEAERLLAELFPDAETSTETEAETETEREAETAALSDEDREAVELANERAETAAREAGEARDELARERFKRYRDKLIADGVPPADIDMARPLLEGRDPEPIELSNGKKVDAADVVRKLLEARKGTIDFTERGSGDGEGSEAAEAKEIAQRWAEGAG